jgi:hypothetical protein
VLRTTNQYLYGLRSLRPYEAVLPKALQPLLQLARRQREILFDMTVTGYNTSLAALVIAWRSKLEAARVFAGEKRNDMAVRFLIEAVKSVENCRNPGVILDALLAVGGEMRALDAGRAAHLLRLATDLAKAIKNTPAQETAAKLLAELARQFPAKLAKP